MTPSGAQFAVVANHEATDTSRLPAYRENRFCRHHPYPRRHRRQTPDYLQSSVDFCYLGKEIFTVPRGTENNAVSQDDPERDLAHLDEALHGHDTQNARVRRLSTLVLDLAFAVRRHRRSIAIVKPTKETDVSQYTAERFAAWANGRDVVFF
ncbi:hypothetical protein POSPLADRAFT_1032115 [Postia placenta MAD-698-R-SB12]|uniref:Uncharacterized protein n=1 Tax=Postia placenta MAD-698-R-SB12 TaxID=670580 RepID=A0A1X6N9J5_9APHY|nr:hypothetical protein POSPLADRAFT_1032115 [Postia placenta MAD-698-R-SB12]OSX65318.1 hypothetical protein POSPLADRAFT_1032115 [Postia placenta MAD-698-R-SB12]